MSERVLDRVIELADQFKEQAVEAEKIGKLPDATVKSMKAIGSIRLLQPASHGGLEVHPREFAETVMATAALDPAAGWINGVVGVHPYQLAYADPRVADEIWADDVDTWVASPYAPQGVAKPVDGGYIFNGRWQFSSGTDALRLDHPGRHDRRRGRQAADAATDAAHDPAPQGLRDRRRTPGTSWGCVAPVRRTSSSRTHSCRTYRTMDAMKVMDGTAQMRGGHDQDAVQDAVVDHVPAGHQLRDDRHLRGRAGRPPGLPARARRRQRHRHQGRPVRDVRRSAEAAAEINAARQEILANVDRIYDIVDAGKEVSFEDRAAGRRTQVRAVWRAVAAVDQIFARSGGNALRMDKPLQRYWRDAHAGVAHAIHVPGTVYHASALSSLGVDPQGPLRAMI